MNVAEDRSDEALLLSKPDPWELTANLLDLKYVLKIVFGSL
jgi:hypothetical protein